MTHTSTSEPVAPQTRPARPNLFAPSATGTLATQPRISVLASLDTRPAPAPRKSHNPIWLAVIGVFGACALGAGAWIVLNHATPGENLAMRHPVPPPTASSPARTETSHLHQETAAPASIETLPADPALGSAPPTPSSEPDVTTRSTAAQAPVERIAAKTDNTPTKPHRSLLSTLAAKSDTPKTTTVRNSPRSSKISRAEKEAMDTDVILLEALVAHNKKKDAIPAADGDAKP